MPIFFLWKKIFLTDCKRNNRMWALVRIENKQTKPNLSNIRCLFVPAEIVKKGGWLLSFVLHVSKQSKVILTQTIYHMLYRQFTGLWDYSIHLHLPKQPVVIYSFLSTDDSLDFQSSAETKRRIFPSADKASQRTDGTTVDPEGIPDDFIIISFLNAVAVQKC